MPDLAGPFDGSTFGQAPYYRDRGYLERSGVRGLVAASAAAGDLALTAAGFALSMALGRAHVRGAAYERTGSAWTYTVPANTSSAGPRRDLLVLRRDLVAKTVVPTYLQGTAAASPVDPTITQNEDGTWDLPLFRVQAPPSSGTPLVITDLRRWVDQDDDGWVYVLPFGTVNPPAGVPVFRSGWSNISADELTPTNYALTRFRREGPDRVWLEGITASSPSGPMFDMPTALRPKVEKPIPCFVAGVGGSWIGVRANGEVANVIAGSSYAAFSGYYTLRVTGHLWVLGDSWTDPRSYAVPAYGRNWSYLLAERFGLGMVNSAVSGSAYSWGAQGGGSFPAQAAQGWGHGAAAVIVFGGLNDANGDAGSDVVGGGATLTYGLIRRLCPDAPLLVVGPQWGARPWSPALNRIRGVLRDAATAAAVDVIDPSSWLLNRHDLLIDADHPNGAGHVLLADRLEHDVALALEGRRPTLPA